MSLTNPIDVFIAYAKADHDLLERLRIQLSAAERIGLVDTWHDGEIEIGTNTEEAMKAAMNKAEIVLLLISADFFASEVYEKELPLAMSLHREGKAKVLPIILRECTWQMTPIAGLKVLPPNGEPVTSKHWTSPDQAFRLVVDEVIRLSSELRGTPIPKGNTTITTEHQEYTKTVIAHQSTDDRGTFNWKPLLMGLAAFLFVALIGFQVFSKKDTQEPIAQQEKPKELPNEATDRPLEEHKSKPVQTQPQKPKPQKTEQQTVPTKKESSPPPSFDQPEPPIQTAPKVTKQYQLSNNVLTDLRDQKHYPVVQLNGLTWMAKNLALSTPGYKCFGNVEQNCQQFGGLYSFELAQKVCPEGWRMPTMAEWISLQPAQVAALQLPLAGIFDGNGGWLMHQVTGYYWTSERSFAGEAKAFRISKNSSGKESRYTKWGLSCRCVLDE